MYQTKNVAILIKSWERKRNNKMRERKKVSFINFLCNPQERTQKFTLKQTTLLSFCKSFVFKMYAF